MYYPSYRRVAKTCLILLTTLFYLLFSAKQASSQVTAIYTDYGGYWTSSSTTQNPVKPDNSHNLLGFTWNGVTYSTGVNDAALTGHSVSFTPLVMRAFPINSVPSATAASYFVMLGQLYDGINNGVDNSATTPFPANPSGAGLASFLTDGVKGLNLGTGLANIPSGSTLTFQLSSNGISLSAINDGRPDFFVTQEASTTSANPDVFKFVDAGGNTVGNTVSVVTSGLPIVGNWQADFYDLNSTQVSPTYINGARPLAYYAADLSAFGITTSNYMNAVALVYQPNGTSDPAFIAFNQPSISVASVLNLSSQPSSYTDGISLSPAPEVQIMDGQERAVTQAGIPVSASVSSGSGTLSGTVTVNTDNNGLATFSNLIVSGGGNVTLTFKSASLDPAVTSTISPVTLPLTWLSFTAKSSPEGILLQWSTAAERNTKDFVIQRSAGDGAPWQDIGTLTAKGSSLTNNYQYTDNSPLNGLNDYRIQQRDLDGNSTYSTIRTASTNDHSAVMSLYPNPVTDGVLNITLQQAGFITLYNESGIPVLRKQLTAGPQQLRVGALSKGIYSLHINKAAYRIEIL